MSFCTWKSLVIFFKPKLNLGLYSITSRGRKRKKNLNRMLCLSRLAQWFNSNIIDPFLALSYVFIQLWMAPAAGAPSALIESMCNKPLQGCPSLLQQSWMHRRALGQRLQNAIYLNIGSNANSNGEEPLSLPLFYSFFAVTPCVIMGHTFPGTLLQTRN